MNDEILKVEFYLKKSCLLFPFFHWKFCMLETWTNSVIEDKSTSIFKKVKKLIPGSIISTFAAVFFYKTILNKSFAKVSF